MRKFLIGLVLILIGGAGGYYIKQMLDARDIENALSPELKAMVEKEFSFDPTKVEAISKSLPKVEKPKGVFHPKTVKLKNGLQVVVIHNPRAPVVKQFVFYKVGSMDDPPGKSGIAHFLEHLMFLGKSKYAAPQQFDKQIIRLGGHSNAWTMMDHTAYYEEVPKGALEEIIKLEAGRMEELHLTADQVKSERDVILEERSLRIDNNPERIFAEAVVRALYQNNEIGRPIIGWRHEMEGLNLKDVQEFHFHWYCPNNAVLVIVGDVTMEDVLPMVRKYYGSIESRPIKRRYNLRNPVDRGVRFHLSHRSPRVKQPTLERIYLVPSLSYGDTTKIFPLRVLRYILSEGQNSKLYQHFVKKKKMASVAEFSNNTYKFMGPAMAAFNIYPNPGYTNKDLLKELNQFVAELLEKGVTEQEVEEAKKRMLLTFEYARDNVFSGGYGIGTALVRGRTWDEVEALPNYLENVTHKQVMDVLKWLFSRKDYLIAELLPGTEDSLKTESIPGRPGYMITKASSGESTARTQTIRNHKGTSNP